MGLAFLRTFSAMKEGSSEVKWGELTYFGSYPEERTGLLKMLPTKGNTRLQRLRSLQAVQVGAFAWSFL